jgi:methionine-gamma-lyase
LKPPVFLTSTFEFASAEEGKRFFEVVYGLRDREPDEELGLIYSRLNNPNLQIFEERMAAWDCADKGAVFSSGMAAISTTLLATLRPGDHIVSTCPIYGGTYFLFEHVLPQFGIQTTQVIAGPRAHQRMREAVENIEPQRVRMLYVETPANPSNALVDIEGVSALARELSEGRERPVLTVVDNTFLGPVFQRPIKHGADLVICSATKFIGGHSDLIAGVVTGRKEIIDLIATYRTILGTMATPFSGWLLLRSLETVSIRMRRQAKSATRLARLLAGHPAVESVYYPGLIQAGDPSWEVYHRQCSGPGSLIAFVVRGGAEAAFRVLDRFEVVRLAVSLGGTESLVEHPMSMTHSDVPPERLEAFGVRPGLIRMSVGLEHLSDLKRDLLHALEAAVEG